MKISFTISPAEATSVVREVLAEKLSRVVGNPVTVAVELEKESPASNPVVNDDRIADFIRNMNPSEGKIPLIRLIRTLIPGLGLASAKYFVEGLILRSKQVW